MTALEPVDPHAVLERIERSGRMTTDLVQFMRDAEALARAAIHLRELAEAVTIADKFTVHPSHRLRELHAEVLRVFGSES